MMLTIKTIPLRRPSQGRRHGLDVVTGELCREKDVWLLREWVADLKVAYHATGAKKEVWKMVALIGWVSAAALASALWL